MEEAEGDGPNIDEPEPKGRGRPAGSKNQKPAAGSKRKGGYDDEYDSAPKRKR